MPKYFLFDKEGPITTITFNRPEVRNCLDEAVVLEFESLLQQVRDDRETRALIVTGAGPAFCAGADTSKFRDVADPEERRRLSREIGRRLPRLIGRAFDVLAHLDAITIGAINGYAVGGGWSFALALDFCIAAEEAEFWVPEVDLAVPYRGAPAKALAARVGPWIAKEIILLCRHYRAPELLALGLINRVVKREELMAAAREMAGEIMRKPADALASSKRDINSSVFGERLF